MNNCVTIKSSLGFNNFIHNSEKGEVLLAEPVVLYPQLLQSLKGRPALYFIQGWRLRSSAGRMRMLKLRLAQTFIEMKTQLWPKSFTIKSERDISLNDMYVNVGVKRFHIIIF